MKDGKASKHPWMNDVNDGCLVNDEGSSEKISELIPGGNWTHELRDAIRMFQPLSNKNSWWEERCQATQLTRISCSSVFGHPCVITEIVCSFPRINLL